MKKTVLVLVLLLVVNGLRSQWMPINTGITLPEAGHAIATDGTYLYAGVADSLSGGIYRSSDLGSTWTPINVGLPSLSVWCITASGSKIFASIAGYGIFLSTNFGASWTAVNTGLSSAYVSTIAIVDSFAYAGTVNAGVFKSQINTGTYNWIAMNSGLTSLDVKSMAVTDSNTIFVGTQKAGPSVYGIYRSTNGGSSWTQVNTGITGSNVDFVSALISKDSIILAGTGLTTYLDPPELFSSDNRSAISWVASSSGIPAGSEVNSFHSIGNKIFAGCASGGPGAFYYSTNKGASWTSWSGGLATGHIVSQTSIGPLLFIASNEFGGGFYKRDVSNIPNGIDNVEEFGDLVVYPNPGTGNFKIETSAPVEHIAIFDMMGRMICAVEVKSKELEIDLSDEVPGIYFLRLTNKDGKMGIKKIIKL